MNLLFLYGPPASGKLTIGNELKKLTGYPLFHNHLTYDFVHSLYPDNLPDHFDLIDNLRLNVIEYCARNNTGLIYTYVYEGTDDDEFVTSIINTVESHDGKIIFIEVSCPDDVLLSRVGNKSRKAYQKLTDQAKLSTLLKERRFASMPQSEILKVDTSKVSPTEAAEYILSHTDHL